jgi:hypothetical protein
MVCFIPDNTPEFTKLRALTCEFILENPNAHDLPSHLSKIRDLLIDKKMDEARELLGDARGRTNFRHSEVV